MKATTIDALFLNTIPALSFREFQSLYPLYPIQASRSYLQNAGQICPSAYLPPPATSLFKPPLVWTAINTAASWLACFQSCPSLSQCPWGSQNHLLKTSHVTSRQSPAEIVHRLPSSLRKFNHPVVRQKATLACISQLISGYFSSCWSCFGSIILLSVSWVSCFSQPQGLHSLSTAWDVFPTVPLIADPSSLSWNVISSEKTACALIKALVTSLAWHTISFTAHIIIYDYLFVYCLPPTPTPARLEAPWSCHHCIPLLGLVLQDSIWHKTCGSRTIS